MDREDNNSNNSCKLKSEVPAPERKKPGEGSGTAIIQHGTALVVVCLLVLMIAPGLEKFFLTYILPTPLTVLESLRDPVIDNIRGVMKDLFRLILSMWSCVIFLAAMCACLKKDRVMAVAACVFLFIMALGYLLFCSGAVSMFAMVYQRL